MPDFADETLPVFGINRPARRVSGDFYDVMRLTERQLWFVLGDVSGKGMNAALLMAKTASVFRCLAKTLDRPGILMARINDELCETSSHGMFVTMIAGLLDLSEGTVILANAGHEPPLLFSLEETFSTIPATAPPVGILTGLKAEDFPETRLTLAGGILYVFTDGLTEAYTNAAEKQMLGVEGVMDLIRHSSGKPLRQRLAAMAAAVLRSLLRDDLTLFAVDGTLL